MTRVVFAIALCFIVACQSSKPGQEMEKAFALHEMAIQMHDSLKMELTSLQKQELTMEGQQKLARLRKSSEEWEDNLVEVPGFEHAHEEKDGHSHDHSHDHSHHRDPLAENLKDLPAAEMLKLQQAILDEVHQLLKESRQLGDSNSQGEK